MKDKNKKQKTRNGGKPSKEEANKANPFELRTQKQKFNVLGRNLKDIEKASGQSKHIAHELVPPSVCIQFAQTNLPQLRKMNVATSPGGGGHYVHF